LVRSFRKPFQHQHDTSWWQPFFRRYLLILLIALFTTAAQNVSEIEAPPTLPARTLATAALLAGQGFRVDSPVPTDGLTALFTIRSSVGTFSAPGLEMLRIRLGELPAIVQLQQTSKTGVFAESLAKTRCVPYKPPGRC
jgi:hypothetical protein